MNNIIDKRFFLLTPFILVLSLALTGCGGGSGNDANSDTALSDQPSNDQTSNDQINDQTETNDGQLIAPTVTDNSNNSGLSIRWNDSNAESYRVLFWTGDDSPQEHQTSDLEFTINTASGNYQVIVEAYDELGNSMFSTPISVEVN